MFRFVLCDYNHITASFTVSLLCLFKTPTGLKDVMAKDVQSTGVCHYTSLKETFWNNPIFTALAKKSPYTEYLSRA